jgi:hypothetical protein
MAVKRLLIIESSEISVGAFAVILLNTTAADFHTQRALSSRNYKSKGIYPYKAVQILS